jgi:hypothetical protein
MEMDEGRGEVVLALVGKNFGHLPQYQSLMLLLQDEDTNLKNLCSNDSQHHLQLYAVICNTNM